MIIVEKHEKLVLFSSTEKSSVCVQLTLILGMVLLNVASMEI